MRKLLIAALLGGVAAVPAQAAETFTLRLDAVISGTQSWYNGSPVWTTVPFGPLTTSIDLTGSWETGFNSWFAPCESGQCLKSRWDGNTLWLESFGTLPCWCSESFRLEFDRPFDGQIGPLSEHFISGSYSFFEATYATNTQLSGTISSLAVPEPATWAMMIGGFALAGAALRRKRYRVAFA